MRYSVSHQEAVEKMSHRQEEGSREIDVEEILEAMQAAVDSDRNDILKAIHEEESEGSTTSAQHADVREPRQDIWYERIGREPIFITNWIISHPRVVLLVWAAVTITFSHGRRPDVGYGQVGWLGLIAGVVSVSSIFLAALWWMRQHRLN